jgi:hypothetical protein
MFNRKQKKLEEFISEQEKLTKEADYGTERSPEAYEFWTNHGLFVF